ncbi:MAG TPA: exopolysaccharide biosynthesis polyprenyl glycosylphosphotransferase [Solirubrobacterales bacterium]|jgi:exopolysaccharide biosynthesis polyprenyl glycosylphosphotransferase|nr:exopolysaccharide biosynthesis polyprenyl glycosylphosphotransferase [Solirubrobacterales bacterium]
MSSSDVTTTQTRPVTITDDLAPRTRVGRRSVRRHNRFWRDARRRRFLATADVIAAVAASASIATSTTMLIWALSLLPIWVVLAKLFGLYDRDQGAIRPLTLDELPAIAAWGAAGAVVLGLLLPLTHAGDIGLAEVVRCWAVATVCGGVLRALSRWVWRRTTPPELTAVIGNGQLADAVQRKVELFGDMHLDLAPSRRVPVAVGRQPQADLRRLVRGLDRVIVASERLDPEFIGQLAGVCRDEQAKLNVVSPLRGRAGAVPRLAEVADLPILEYDTRDPSRSTILIKRGFDLFVATLGLLVLAPLFPLVLAAIKLDSRGPAIFVQLRAGRRAVPFRMYKLRTMTMDAEDELAALISLDALAEPVFKLRPDPRVTRVGRFLRRFSLDELPQLVNVLRGEMSIVGPRPEEIEVVRRYRPEHRFRLDVKPGMTGPMQVYGRGDLTFSERLAVELDYVENPSLGRDLRILLQTIPAALRGRGAY